MTLLGQHPSSSSSKSAAKCAAANTDTVTTRTRTTTTTGAVVSGSNTGGAGGGDAFPIAQLIPGCLYFTSFPTRRRNGGGAIVGTNDVPKSDQKCMYIDIDSHVHYDAFYDDFGPLNLAVLYRFCHFLHTLVQHNNNSTEEAAKKQEQTTKKRRIFLYTNEDPQCRVNAVFLLASYMMIYHHLSAEQAYLRLQSAEPPPFVGFRDAALGPPSYLLHVQHVIKAVEKALKFKWLDFSRFDPDEYEHFERVENGDLNWIVPDKLLSFCGPHDRSYVENGYPYHSPEVYFDYFRAHNVTTIVRLNKKVYDAKRFTDAGFAHHDLFFIDGSTPSEHIVLRFLHVVDSAKGAVAVHCKAGLGRTGCMIACWMMKHHRLTAPQCMGWLRVCRPGSVIGPQQQFLIEKQAWCWGLAKADGLCNLSRLHGLESSEEEQEEDTEEQIRLPKMNGETTMISNNENGDDLSLKNGGRRRVSNRMVDQMDGDGRQRNNEKNNKKECCNNNNNSGINRVVTQAAPAADVMAQEMALNEAGQSQGDRLCEIKARTQLGHQHNRHLVVQQQTDTNNTTGGGGGGDCFSAQPSGSSASSKFVAPPPSAQAGTRTPNTMTTAAGTPTTTTPSSNNNSNNFCYYSSATTPIKQLRLSSTIGGGHAPAFVKINANTGTHHHYHHNTLTTTPVESGKAATSSSSNSNTTTINNIINSNKQPFDPTTPLTTNDPSNRLSRPQRTKNPIAAINRLPIQKVSVSSSLGGSSRHSNVNHNHHYQSSSSTPLRVHQLLHHRKQHHHPFSSASAARPKPYQPSECETAHRFATEMASTTQASAQHSYSNALKKQYNAISTACQQQPMRHTRQNKGNDTTTTTTASNNNNGISSCSGKYELRPRELLHLPSRFGLEQSPAGAAVLLPPLTAVITKNSTNNSSNNCDGGIATMTPPPPATIHSPYLLARHQRATKSASSALFPTTSASARSPPC